MNHEERLAEEYQQLKENKEPSSKIIEDLVNKETHRRNQQNESTGLVRINSFFNASFSRNCSKRIFFIK